MLTIFEDAKTKARGARALMACANSQTCLKAKLHPSRHEGGGAVGVKSKSIKAKNTPTIEDKVVAYACIC
jgi:hypothetical protein